MTCKFTRLIFDSFTPAFTLVLALALLTSAPARALHASVVVVVAPEGIAEHEIVLRDAATRDALDALGSAVLSTSALPAEAVAQRVAQEGWPGNGEPPDTEPLDAALSTIHEAQEQLLAADLEAAEETYRRALRSITADPVPLAIHPESADVLFDATLRYVRLAHRLGRDTEADAAMAALVCRESPERIPSTEQHPAATITAYTELRDRLRRDATPIVIELVRPSSAGMREGEVARCRTFIDGRLVAESGVTSLDAVSRLELDLPQGRHRVQVACGPRWSAVRVVDVPGADAQLRFDPDVEQRIVVAPTGLLSIRADERQTSDEAWLRRAARAVADGLRVSDVALAIGPDPVVKVFRVSREEVRVLPLLGATPPPPSPRVWTWVSLGVGVGLAATGGYFHWKAQDETRRINGGAERIQERNTAKTLMGVFYGVGAAALAGTVALWFLESPPDHHTEESASPTLRLCPHPTGFSLEGRF